MQFTIDQYIALITLAAAMMVFGFFSYHCGLKDRGEKTKNAAQEAGRLQIKTEQLAKQLALAEFRADHSSNTDARAIELLNDELEASNLVKRRQLAAAIDAQDLIAAYETLAADQQHDIEQLKKQLLTEAQRKTLVQAAGQLAMIAQLLDAIKNKEAASTARTLSSRLRSIIESTEKPAPINEAA